MIRLRKNQLLPVSALLATVAVAGVASAAVQRGEQTVDRAAGFDAARVTPAAVSARGRARDGHELGVITYRNKSGRLCVAAGRLNGTEVGAYTPSGAFKPMPLTEGGNCTFVPDPVAFTVVRAADNPVTAVDETAVEIYGLAQASVRAVAIKSGSRTVEAAPATAGAFIAEMAAGTGELEVSARMSDGAVRRLVTIPSAGDSPAPAPSPAQVEEDLRNQARDVDRP